MHGEPRLTRRKESKLCRNLLHIKYKLKLADVTLTLETGKLAKQANGAVLVKYGDTQLLVTACMDSHPNDRDFLPLTVDYREYTYSAGKIPGGFFKREGRPSEREILISRLIDRPLRPLFPEAWRNETQIVGLVLSADSENDPDVIAVTGASAAAFISDLPFDKPIAAVRVGLLEGQLVANPTTAEQKKSLLNIVVAGSEDAIVMIEAGALEVSEDTIAEALSFGHEQIRRIIAAIRELHDLRSAKESRRAAAGSSTKSWLREIEKRFGERLHDALDTAKYPKKESYRRVDELKDEVLATHSGRGRGVTERGASGRLNACARSFSATTCCTTTGVPMGARSIRFGRSPAKWDCCLACTARRFSRAARRRRWRR